MATIKPIAGKSVHQIQSGQVIVDLVSVVKELVENSLDAGATSIDIRFKNNGLDSIEVQDNGPGISYHDYDTIALKNTTSKLSNYDDLASLQTFGFRGEALSSLCALSSFHIITAREEDAPKGTRLDFEVSGSLKGTQVVAAPKGTTVVIETLFKNLPVRRQQLEANVKREYSKAIGVLQAYACISTNVRISVSNVMAKGKKAVVFATKSNPSTKENIANVYGAKAIPALVALDLKFDMQPSDRLVQLKYAEGRKKLVRVMGFVSKPIFGEGRQTPDRQMFFVNSRPCGLPQVAKIVNEVYKSYNFSQSPFVFANLMLDTNAYDVNVSPDKRKIMLHDQAALLDSIKSSLMELFDGHQQTIPQSQQTLSRLPPSQQLDISRERSKTTTVTAQSELSASSRPECSNDAPDIGGQSVEPRNIINEQANDRPRNLIYDLLDRKLQTRTTTASHGVQARVDHQAISTGKQSLGRKLVNTENDMHETNDHEDDQDGAESDASVRRITIPVLDFNDRIAEQQESLHDDAKSTSPAKEDIPDTSDSSMKPNIGVVQEAFNNMRAKRAPQQIATITIGSKTITSVIGSTPKRRRVHETPSKGSGGEPTEAGAWSQAFHSSMRAFKAPQMRPTVFSSDDGDGREDCVSLAEVEDDDKSRSQLSDRPSPKGSNSGTDEDNIFEVDGEQGSVDDFLARSEKDGSEQDFVDDEEKRQRENAKVARLIQKAEEKPAKPSQDNVKRANRLLKGSGQRHSTTDLLQTIDASIERIDQEFRVMEESIRSILTQGTADEGNHMDNIQSAEERLSLSVSKDDFTRMRIIGQFNLGFIIVARPAQSSRATKDELFIIDQHASDEKYNFERLQASTTVQNQRLVHVQNLDLTAIEEEIILENQDAMLKNGFSIVFDQSGATPVGQRCRLVSLPMSREVTFTTRDLEELIVLLAESHPLTTTNLSSPSSPSSNIPRPSKVRKMFAMRACRSSVMIGKTLTKQHMEKLVRNMGGVDKPWNCPHGRPTMRHLVGLDAWEGWKEGEDEERNVSGAEKIDWAKWIEERKDGEGTATGGAYNDEGEVDEDEEVDISDEIGTESDEDEEGVEESDKAEDTSTE